jgi:hypothetical protein
MIIFKKFAKLFDMKALKKYFFKLSALRIKKNIASIYGYTKPNLILRLQ